MVCIRTQIYIGAAAGRHIACYADVSVDLGLELREADARSAVHLEMRRQPGHLNVDRGRGQTAHLHVVHDDCVLKPTHAR